MKTVDSNFGFKLKKRREEKRLSLQSLGISVGLSKQSIFRYENGEQLPSTSILLKLSEELNVLPTYFFEDDNIEIEINQLNFREEDLINKNNFDVGFVKTICKKYLRNFLELETILKIKNNYINPLEGLIIESEKDVEKAAKKLRRKWRLGNAPISDVTQLIEDNGIYVIEVDMNSTFSGLSGLANENIPLIVINSNVNDKARKRFTTIHELGHIVLDFVEELDNDAIEKYCDHFAGAILLVDDTLEMELGKNRTKISLRELKAIKERYGISIGAIIFRAKSTGLISRETCNDWWSSYNVWRDNSEEFGKYFSSEKPTAFDNLILRGISEQKITWGKAAELKNTKIDLLKNQFKNEPALMVS
ncbi:HTH-type transcriptional repressor RghR [Polaribacter huanghezhanensis]|nr:HTH-type transcriptional repressor RghR [Polaribacter huanghezhanensis]